MNVLLDFLLAGMIISIGYASDYLFKRKGVPDIIFLILIGVLLGPVGGFATPQSLAEISPLFVSLALAFILFDAGLNLKVKKTAAEIPRAFFLAFVGMIVSSIVVFLISYFFYDVPLRYSVLLGVVLSGTSSSIVAPLVSRVSKLEDKTKNVLILESVITDVLVVVIGLFYLQILTKKAFTSVYSMISSVFLKFLVGGLIGFVVGILWLKFLEMVKKEEYNDILTVGILLFFYAITEAVKGSGAIFSLVFGLTLSNVKEFSSLIGIKLKKINFSMKRFMDEISFFIKTFFFVFLGLIFEISSLPLLIYGIFVSILLLLYRYPVVRCVSGKEEGVALALSIPRGLSAAVFANMFFSSVSLRLSSMITSVIFFSVLFTAVGLMILSRKK